MADDVPELDVDLSRIKPSPSASRTELTSARSQPTIAAADDRSFLALWLFADPPASPQSMTC